MEGWRVDWATRELYSPEIYYRVDLDCCRSVEEVLDWIAQISGKTWCTPLMLAGLVRCLDDVLNFQGRLCGFAMIGTSRKSRPPCSLKTLVAHLDQRRPEWERERATPVEVEPEMGATVALFKRLDDAVRQVQIVAGDQKVSAFVLRDGHWHGMDLR